ncbi:MAG TPA: DUF2442 domain-containing protein [Cellvibrionaceae bacterium]|nr:DUF2442 domain-containing protein [Cellvibrionaceae bacterium]
MNPSVTDVSAIGNYLLQVKFENGELKIFDVSPYLDKGIFTELKNESYFKQVRVAFGAVEWPHEQDFSKDTLYLLGTPISANTNPPTFSNQ